MQAKLTGDTLDSVLGVEILDQHNLVACCTALSGDDGRAGKEVLPYLRAKNQQLRLRVSIQTMQLGELTRNHRLPYLASTLPLLAIQFLYHLHSVAE
jgi:hypothetical protein